jgi:hypothetical protein
MRAMTRSTVVALSALAVVVGLAVVWALAGEAMPSVILLAFVLAGWALWAAAIFAVVYFATRLAIRHERRTAG